MYNQGEIEARERRKVVFFAGATVTVILALIVAIVVVAMGKANREMVGIAGNDNDKGEFALEWSESEPETTGSEATEGETETPSLVGGLSTETASEPETTEEPMTKEPEVTKPEPTTSATSLPSTGPEDLVPLALALGSLTTVVSAIMMRRRA